MVHFVIGNMRRCVPYHLMHSEFDEITSIAILASIKTIAENSDRLDACRLARRMIKRELAWRRRKVDSVLLKSISLDNHRHDVIPDRYFAKCSELHASLVRMIHEDDLSREQIMERLNMSRAAVSSLQQRAYASVRKAIVA